MTLHLIDGRAGRAHITSDDIARLNTALVGEKHCVFEYFENLKCTMQSSGRAMISTGAGMVDGHRFVVSSAETVQLSGGSVGMRRIRRKGVKNGTQAMISISADSASATAKASMASGAIRVTKSGVINVCASWIVSHKEPSARNIEPYIR